MTDFEAPKLGKGRSGMLLIYVNNVLRVVYKCKGHESHSPGKNIDSD